MQSKRCTKCGETKALAEFHRNRSKCDGLQSQCKECIRAYDRAYHEAHREEKRAYWRTYHEAHREERNAYSRAYHEEHWEERRAYREARQEEIKASDRAYRLAYREAHREECNALVRKQQTEYRDASREVATRNGEPWTPAEDHVVLTSEGTILDIAIELGRTTDSVHSRRERLRRKAVTA